MATETYRKQYGETPEGYVVVVGFGGQPDDNGVFAEVRYEVRLGNHTIATRETEQQAAHVAEALLAKVEADEPEAEAEAEAEPEVEAEPEPVAPARRSR